MAINNSYKSRQLVSTRDNSSRTARDEIDIHQDMMNQMQETMNACMDATESCIAALDTLNAHNTDASAHPDLRSTVENSGTVTTTQLDERIEQHNTSTTAHPDLVRELKDLINDNTTLIDTVTGKITDHNRSELAHADIRTSISEINNLLGSANVTEMKSTLTSLDRKVNDTIGPAITQLQSVDAKHDIQIAENKESIAELNKSIKSVGQDVDGILSGYAASQTSMDVNAIHIAELDIAERMGLKAKDTGTPNMVPMTHTLPTYVDLNTTVTFTITNAMQDGGSRNISYKLAVGDGDFDISPKDFVSGQEITLQSGETGSPGDINYMILTVIDGDTRSESKRVLAYMITRPIDELTQVSINNLPLNTEPNKTYTCSIRNVVDEGDGRFTYSLDPLQSGILFSKRNDITITDEFNITIPKAAQRGSTLAFQLTSHDIYAAERVKTVNITINDLPSNDEFNITMPTVVAPEQTYQIRMKGIYSIEGMPATYVIEDTSTGRLTFSKTTGIIANENVQVDVAASAPRGGNLTFTVKSVDKNGVQFSFPQTVRVNQLPTSDTITTTLPSSTVGGKSIEMSISGGTDPDDNLRTISAYEIDPADSGLVFATVRGITTASRVSLTIPKVPAQQVRSFYIYAVDEMGEKAVTPKQVNLTVDPIRVIDTPVITSPHEGDEVNPEFTMTWSAYSEHVET